MRVQRWLISGCVLAVMGGLFAAQQAKEPPAGQAMIAAANVFRKALTADQLQRMSFDYGGAERLNWHFIPRERKGLPLKDLGEERKKLARAFIQSGLSEAGYDQALNVMSLEEVLRLLEWQPGKRDEVRQRRDPENYYLSLFGEPAEKGTWGWRLEGHHLSLNFTVKDGVVVASTPEFFGANPATIDAGVGRQIRVLGPEEDIARQILKLATPEQQKVLWVSKTAPDEVPGAGEPQPVVDKPAGLAYAKMSDDQKQLLRDLLSEYLKNMPAGIEQDRRRAIESAGMDDIHFAWWGESEPNHRHAYRVQGATFIIEFNNTQNNANHVHSMWRDVRGDFNVPREATK
jgi:hypothetical protein